MNLSRQNSPPVIIGEGRSIKSIKITREVKDQLGGDDLERMVPKHPMSNRESLKMVMNFKFEQVAFQVGKRP
jgi:hypothetical protein